MTDGDVGLPSTTAWTVAVAALVGTIALAAFDPSVAVGAAFGLVLAAVAAGFSGSYWHTAAASALLPVVGIGAIAAAAGTATGVAGAAMTAVGAVIGITTGGTLSDRLTTATVDRVSTGALFSGLVAGTVALAVLSASQAGGREAVLETILWATGHGTGGLFLAVAGAAIAIGGGLVSLPAGAFARPSTRDSYIRARNGLLSLLAVGVIVAGFLLGTLAVLSWYVPLLEGVAAGIAGSTVVRGAIAVVTAVGSTAIAFGLIVRFSWFGTNAGSNAVVPVLVGSTVGLGGSLPVVLVVGADSPAAVGSLLGVAAVVLVAGLPVRIAHRWLHRELGHGSATVIACTLIAGGVGVGATVDAVAGLADIRVAVISLVAIAAGLFVYDVGRYGRTLARDVGAGASRRPQYVRAGWSALIAAVGVPIAVIGLVAATVFAPTLSAPAAGAVVVALAAVVFGTQLLFR
ncbi:hypothetical protein [Natronobacterium texcoconense]|uniref:Uncharacterized protein n=1 Tax=Natronobacterium texcoconense TaxID=1095778 RepID=A0A1H0ZHX0_NATTX|nr:hypothetical protein [Natronobacterium texcoconense]SDQ26726.1 hypothetical protein SAMN04489842_0284 [Natronobacterium texcoconense]